jgi:hypothetical protein
MENYIMTSIETDVQFVDNASDTYMSDEEREYWIDLEESGNETYQMSDEEQQGFEEHITDEEEEVALYKCEDIRIDNIMNLLTCQPTQAEIEEKSYNARLKKAKQDKLSEDNLYSKQTQQWTNKLANHFNRGIK